MRRWAWRGDGRGVWRAWHGRAWRRACQASLLLWQSFWAERCTGLLVSSAVTQTGGREGPCSRRSPRGVPGPCSKLALGNLRPPRGEVPAGCFLGAALAGRSRGSARPCTGPTCPVSSRCGLPSPAGTLQGQVVQFLGVDLVKVGTVTQGPLSSLGELGPGAEFGDAHGAASPLGCPGRPCTGSFSLLCPARWPAGNALWGRWIAPRCPWLPPMALPHRTLAGHLRAHTLSQLRLGTLSSGSTLLCATRVVILQASGKQCVAVCPQSTKSCSSQPLLAALLQMLFFSHLGNQAQVEHTCNSGPQPAARGFPQGKGCSDTPTLQDSEEQGLPGTGGRAKAGLGEPLLPELGCRRKGSHLRELPSFLWTELKSVCLSGDLWSNNWVPRP